MAQQTPVTDIPQPEVLEMATAVVEESSSRGSTPDERAAALAWLRTSTIVTTITAKKSGTPDFPTPDANVGRDVRIANAIVDPPGAAVATPEPDSGRRPRVASSRPPAKMRSAGGPATNGAHAGLAREQLEAVSQQQRRIERRSLILDCALKTLDPPPMREALADLVADISEAARAIGMIVGQATR
jgi:hypothetical protein